MAMLIAFRLSTVHDTDLIDIVNDIPSKKRPLIFRKALRSYLTATDRSDDVIYPTFPTNEPSLKISLTESEKTSKANVNLDENLDNALNF